MLTIDWPQSGNAGWTDYVPMHWFFKTGRHGVCEHQIIGPKDKSYPASCTLVVSSSEASMDYSGENKKINIKNDVDTGVMKLIFSDKSRREVDQILWKEAGESKFENSGTVFGIQEDDIALLEGGRKLVQHLRAERRPELARRKKTDMLAAKGYLECEACDVDLRSTYGDDAQACYEAHHDGVALAKRGASLTEFKGLKVLCANCHRAIHRTGDMMLTVEAFRKRLRIK